MQFPYKDIKFEKRLAKIKNKDGKIILEKEVYFPDYFSDNSVNIVTGKYLCNSAKNEEKSLTDMIDRVSDTITDWGWEQGYFKTKEENDEFNYNLKYFQVHQYCAFNSPVYFNIGLSEKPQLSACFILDVQDDMGSITDILKTESIIFKNGSGSGVNLSNIRASSEKVRSGGFASGPVSFLKTQDINAGEIKSGGTLRRSAKLACLDINHPDIEHFISCKSFEEKKLNILTAAGIKPYPGYDMSDHVFFQNTNFSVGVLSGFMDQVNTDGSIILTDRLNGASNKVIKAKELLMKIAKYAWIDGCPGLLFLDTINDWNTCSNTSTIISSNPCGEFVGLGSCNLASINLLKFFSISDKLDSNGSIDYELEKIKIINFDIETYEKVIKTLITAQDIIINKASYPTQKIEDDTKNYRALGLGFSNLHATLMYLGLPYDSDKGRYVASMLTSMMTATAYKQSADMADKIWSFCQYKKNKHCFKNILIKHRNLHNVKAKSNKYLPNKWLTCLTNQASVTWDNLLKREKFRNSQVTLVAPTGTTSFLMGCDTFGIEPEFALKKYKTLSASDGAEIEITNNTSTHALLNLGYNPDVAAEIFCDLDNLEKSELKKEHLPIFDTAMKNGNRVLTPYAHINMMASVQPFISGAISKTINLPEECTIEDIYFLFTKAYEKGLKGITIYRNNSKNSQPLNTNKAEDKICKDFNIPKSIVGIAGDDLIVKQEHIDKVIDGMSKNMNNPNFENKQHPQRRKLPRLRKALRYHFSIGKLGGYVDTGEYDNGELGEIFIRATKQGSTLNGLLDSLAIVTSMALQYGVPLFDLVRKMKDMKYEPSGLTQHEEIRFAKSIPDFIFRFLAYQYLTKDELDKLGLKRKDKVVSLKNVEKIMDNSNPICDRCGTIMYRIGTCFTCIECGDSTGTCG